MNDFSHGGNLKSLAADARRPERDILDFSVNLRPEGPRIHHVRPVARHERRHALPFSGHAGTEGKAALHYGLSPECFVFGNGANELIHALPAP